VSLKKKTAKMKTSDIRINVDMSTFTEV